MENTFDTSRLTTTASALATGLLDMRKAKNVFKGAFIEARIVGNLSYDEARAIVDAALESATRKAKGGLKGESKALTEAERNLIRKDIQQANDVVRNWEYVPVNMRNRAIAGDVAISGVASRAIAARDKAKANDEANAATDAANAAYATPDVPANNKGKGKPETQEKQPDTAKGVDGQPRKERQETPITAKGMLELAQWLRNDPSMSEAEAKAFVELQEAIAAYNAVTVPLQNAA